MTFKPEVGKPCSFYHSGGSGDERWVKGWRFGYVVQVPKDGAKHSGFIRIEIPVDLWQCVDPIRRIYKPRPRERVWVSAVDVNAPGDTEYHGPTENETLKERRKQKAAEQARADKKMRAGRRFHRS